MNLLPLDQLGPHELQNSRVRFGFLLPWVSAANGNRLFVKIIHEADQFLQAIPPMRFPLAHSAHPKYGDLWNGEVTIDPANRPTPDSAWGTQGRYVYRFELESPLLPHPLDWIIDPYAREYGVGRQSAFTLGYTDQDGNAASNAQSAWTAPIAAGDTHTIALAGGDTGIRAISPSTCAIDTDATSGAFTVEVGGYARAINSK